MEVFDKADTAFTADISLTLPTQRANVITDERMYKTFKVLRDLRVGSFLSYNPEHDMALYICMVHMKQKYRGMLLYHNTHYKATAVLVSSHLK